MLLVLAAQVGLGMVLAAVLAGVYGFVAGYSAMLGCLIAAVPNAFLALRLALPRREPGAKALLRAAYIGEVGKLALTVLFFSLVFATVRPLAAAPLFAGFIVTTLVPLAAAFVGDKQEKEQEAVNSNGD